MPLIAYEAPLIDYEGCVLCLRRSSQEALAMFDVVCDGISLWILAIRIPGSARLVPSFLLSFMCFREIVSATSVAIRLVVAPGVLITLAVRMIIVCAAVYLVHDAFLLAMKIIASLYRL